MAHSKLFHFYRQRLKLSMHHTVPKFEANVYIPRNFSASTKLLEAYRPMDNLVARLHEKYVDNKKKVTVNKKINVINLLVKDTDAVESPLRPSGREDHLVDSEILKLISETEIDSAFDLLAKYALVKRYPTRRTFKRLARVCSENSLFSHLQSVKSIVKTAYPKEYAWEMEYQNYYAEALWKSGDYKNSVYLFEELYMKYPMRSKKLTDMLTFMIIDIVNKKLEDDLPVLEACVQRVYKNGLHHPSAKLWYHTFLSDLGSFNMVSWQLVEECPKIKSNVANRTDDILSFAEKTERLDIIQRFLEAVLRLEADTEYSKVLSALLNFHCACGNYRGAAETFQYAKSQQILLQAEAISNYTNMLQNRSAKG